MIIYVDDKEKICYIMAPKCGSHTISKMLNTDLHTVYPEWHLKNDDYRKIIIIRKDVIDRFLSGFYEDLIANTCLLVYNVFPASSLVPDSKALLSVVSVCQGLMATFEVIFHTSHFYYPEQIY